MAIDTEDKRRSAISGRPFGIFYPVPDGSIAGEDKWHSLGFYSGIAISGVVAVLNFFKPKLKNVTRKTRMKFDG